jgi:hypothetical protein
MQADFGVSYFFFGRHHAYYCALGTMHWIRRTALHCAGKWYCTEQKEYFTYFAFLSPGRNPSESTRPLFGFRMFDNLTRTVLPEGKVPVRTVLEGKVSVPRTPTLYSVLVVHCQ